MAIQNVRFQFNRRTKARWEELNPILLEGEPAVEIHEDGAERLKFGDGVTPYLELPYFTGSSGEFSNPELLAHIDSTDPHPAYDDGTDFFLLYENAKV